ncbi:hypothetical protein BMW23_0550 [Bodo saltans virus]|uniref:Uncharacterized protein n=1 Tax=Bodo saltans virus TaxID=2024608 RepID=A0A2H4UUQ9_9VIRU|nr:hypothetical protein QJ851_gp0534 [Bodo saltans virus]ATZ80597.1 hypothetical protein BMW23_0550 [Bodo saltans virus]
MATITSTQYSSQTTIAPSGAVVSIPKRMAFTITAATAGENINMTRFPGDVITVSNTSGVSVNVIANSGTSMAVPTGQSFSAGRTNSNSVGWTNTPSVGNTNTTSSAAA